MNSMRGRNFNFNNGPDDGWNNFYSGPNFGNFRKDRYSNAYGNYRGGYGPMNTGGGVIGPMNGGGFGPMNAGGFGPMNGGGFGPPNMGPRHFGPRNFGPGPGPRALFSPGEVPFMMGRGFGPRGPNKFKKNNMDNKTVNYLIRCGVLKENLKNLPKSLLQLMEPESCGLCGQNFNSFAISRTHYVSKNHLKNQKKWLTQHSDPGFQQNREIPFKSRDLYCELCDVHITSKAHADSHYAGKPHRAIVEGRKMPRNPALLQKNMASRLEQLIRREKKNLKPVEDEEKGVELEELKASQPDLYCMICKTSVTCSEQMTMHLNGKRHLSKEKQHILKMMKGGSKEDKGNIKEDGGEKGEGNDNTEESAEMEVGEEEKGETTGSQEEEDFDWGNGSGTWDEPETI
ncbi:uncharacterized protein [Battus philenor]|uniref:uncharacterized protein isoform X2 n=1 Tax=Battus philenor TaxID=42288 RepID=UPI0035CF76BD